jgi:hypothetical protein
VEINKKKINLWGTKDVTIMHFYAGRGPSEVSEGANNCYLTSKYQKPLSSARDTKDLIQRRSATAIN